MISSKIYLSKVLLFVSLFLFLFTGQTIYSFENANASPLKSHAANDIVIISTNDPTQASYWQSILNTFATETMKYIVVYEDWPDGADNGLGSLYAFLKGNEKAQELYNINLKNVLASGGAVSLFHCAGVGKRLYPLTASENNNKSAVKIPGKTGTQAILEIVLEHTLSYMPHLKGRLSVFWGDQIFIPTANIAPPKEHVSIFAMVGNFPSAEEWTAKNLNQYGLIIMNEGQAKLVEKTTYPNLLTLVPLKENQQSSDRSVGVSLGSFSISSAMLEELLTAFNPELSKKSGKLNTDYHFWMPLTWPREAYSQFMASKGADQNEVMDVYDRMQVVKKHLAKQDDKLLFGVQNVGEDALWLDFGSIKSYYKNLMALLSNDKTTSTTLAAIFGIDKARHYLPEKNILLINCEIDEIEATNSIFINAKGKKVVASESIIINSTFNELAANQAVIYNVKDDEHFALTPGEVRADLFFEQEPNQVIVYSSIHRDIKEEWNVLLPKNEYSFEELYRLNEKRPTVEKAVEK